jgi:hypothetical protein
MARVVKARRQAAVAHLAEYARLQAVQAQMVRSPYLHPTLHYTVIPHFLLSMQRGDAWSQLLPAISSDQTALDASRETVAALARKVFIHLALEWLVFHFNYSRPAG